MDTPHLASDMIWEPRAALTTLSEKLSNGVDLNSGEIRDAVALLLSADLNDEVKAEFLTALHNKGETAEEIVAFVEPVMKRAVDPMIDPAQLPGPIVDICGTGGGGVNLVYSSTPALFCG